MSKSLTPIQIFNRLAAERKFTACVAWMRERGKAISLSTLRRALASGGATPRQRLAIDLATEYLGAIEGPATTPPTNHTDPVKRAVA